MSNFHYHSGESRGYTYPLDRFLPEVPSGSVRSWLSENTAPGGWILDPFGMHPMLALEAAQAGYKVLVSCNNPIMALMLEVLASAPKEADFQGVLADLAAEKKGGQRLENYILSLYETKCPSCNRMVPARKFLWDRDRQASTHRIVNCPGCGGEKELPVDQADLDKLRTIQDVNLPKAWALEKMGALNDEQQAIVNETINSHPTRSLYVLFTLLNRVEATDLPEAKRKLLLALLIAACEHANSLWPAGEGRNRPLQLGTPPRYSEFNLWQIMEESIPHWCFHQDPVPFVKYPQDLPTTGGICMIPGRMRFIYPLKDHIEPAAIVTILPRSNQAFWTLSALWSGWMFGKDAVTPIRSALDRQRYDWHWLTQALHSTLTPLHAHVPNIPFFAVLSDLTPGSLLATLAGAQMSGWELSGLSIRSDEDLGQFLWQKALSPPVFLETDMGEKIIIALEQMILERGEPLMYLEAFTVELATALRERKLIKYDDQIPMDLLSTLQSSLINALANSGKFLSFGVGVSQTSKTWWRDGLVGTLPSLSEKVEERVAVLMEAMGEGNDLDIDQTICKEFPGIIAPADRLVKTCIESYSDPVPGNPGSWKFRKEDIANNRKSELDQMILNIKLIAQQLHLTPIGDNPITWQDESGVAQFIIYISNTTMIKPFLPEMEEAKAQKIAWILPGARIQLLGYRLQKDMHLAEKLSGWHFVKYRHFRELQGSRISNLDSWASLLISDPVDWEQSKQIAML